MKLSLLSRIAGIALLTAGLAGCVDMTMDITVVSDTAAKATTTMVMAASVYPMVKAAGEQGSSDEPFCKDEGDTLTENADGSATCVTVSEGKYADLKLDDGQSKPTFTVVSPGVVRIAVSTKDFSKDVGGGEQDEQTQAMMKQYFEGHFLTLRFGGKRVTDTNMTLNADKTSAEIVIPFIDMMNGTAKLPEELYAVIDTN